MWTFGARLETSAHVLMCAWFSAKTAYGECPWLLLWFHHFWWIGGLISGHDRRMIPSFVSRSFWSISTVMIGGHNRRSKPPIRPGRFNLSGLIMRLNRRFGNRQMKMPLYPYSSRIQFSGCDQRPNRRMKPPIVLFQGQTCLFTCSVFDVYKYITFSSLWT